MGGVGILLASYAKARHLTWSTDYFVIRVKTAGPWDIPIIVATIEIIDSWDAFIF